ncbi:MAG TPA: SMC family ATPase, partial [Micromonosporaceae bacterium]|nr:SMC family ATPase [Micromonosporaceae bacterium]
MRPLRLDMHGFTVFREPTTVDLTDADFFALVGPTGSGKSTVLDAICFALYGTVPRWGDRRRIENALAPSATEARVRLVFEAAGARFVATRVVRRDSRGRVTTTHAGLEQLPPGFNLTAFDAAPTERGEAGLGVVLAGTPSEMEDAVVAAVGLPYEQFTSCVVLPQGEFARFLHAKRAERQEILINLLGLHVYQRIGQRAGIVQREAEAKVAATRRVLADLTGNEEALAEAERALAAANALRDTVEQHLPALIEATEAGRAAQADLAAVDRDLSLLREVRAPRDLAGLGAEVAAAREAATAAEKAVIAAEEQEEKVRAELAAAGDRDALRRLVELHGQHAALLTRVEELASGVATARAEHDHATTALDAARTAAEQAAKALAEAQRAVEDAQTADLATGLRVHLVAGQPCPVCTQPVQAVPEVPATSAVAAARAQLATAEKASRAAEKKLAERDRALRDLERMLAAATAQHDESAGRLAAIAAELEGAPDLSTVESQLAAIAAAEAKLTAATESVRVARREARTASAGLRAAEERLRSAWLHFDTVRDGLAALGPPPADRDDIVSSWESLQEWAVGAARERTAARDATVAVAEAALAAITDVVGRLDAAFAEAGQDPVRPAGDPNAYRQAAVVAVERAAAAHSRLVERREQAARLAEQVAEHEREAQVAKSLALHLKANQFEQWLLTEALDALVTGASQILRELSGGQYDLAHEKGEFFVVDHAEAGLRRGVRTLSGGETFQASLALALALSEQLAGLSATSASLESIMLDEGFGTLDSATLDTVAVTLENLAARGDRMVGVVTHVAALAERIP